jgi:hypothetical protein
MPEASLQGPCEHRTATRRFRQIRMMRGEFSLRTRQQASARGWCRARADATDESIGLLGGSAAMTSGAKFLPVREGAFARQRHRPGGYVDGGQS